MTMTDLASVTDQTLAMTEGQAKDAILSDVAKAIGPYDVNLGLQGYLLAAPAKFLVPVLSPFRNRIPRTQAAVGSLASHWKAIIGINVNHARPGVAFGSSGTLVDTETFDYLASYKPIALGDTVSKDAQFLARNFDDLRARSGTNLLYALMIEEDKYDLGAQNFALPVTTAPALTDVGSGGSIGASPIYVSVRARTLENYHFGGGTIPSPEHHLTPGGSGHSLKCFEPAVVGAVAYDWYQSADGTTWYYYTTTTTNAVTMTKVIVADQAPPALPDFQIDTILPDGTNTHDHTYAVAHSADTSGDPEAYNGLLATGYGDYLTVGGQVTYGTAGGSGMPSGATWLSLDNNPFTPSGFNGVLELDDLLLGLWNSARVSPTLGMMSARTHIAVTNAAIGSGGGYTVFPPQTASERANYVGGVLMASYLNRAANGQAIPLMTQPHLPDGLVVFITEVLPYPNSEVPSVYEIETQQEYTQFEYPAARLPGVSNGGPRYDLEVRAIQVLKNHFPAGIATVANAAV